MAWWDMYELTCAMQELVRRMNSQSAGVPCRVGATRVRVPSRPARWLPISAGSMSDREPCSPKCGAAREREELAARGAAARVARSSLSDRLLDPLIADA